MSDLEDSENRVRGSLEALTGFGHAVFFQTGTAALEALIQLLSSPGDRVALPALSCWTLASAVMKLGRSCSFCDIDEHWGARLDETGGLAILMDPWGGVADWRQGRARPSQAKRIVDMTLSPGARIAGSPAASWCEAGVISFGGSKPLSIHGGGVALFRDARLAREAVRLFRFGFQDGRWVRRLERYSFSPHLFPVLERTLEAAPNMEEAGARAERAREQLKAFGLSSNGLRPGADWGLGRCLPLLLPEGFPLSARDVEGVAMSSGLRVTRHPVTPAYAEAAFHEGIGRDDVRGSRDLRRAQSYCCPNAEDIGPRLLFGDLQALDVAVIGELLDRLLAAPEEFRSPFPLPRAEGHLPADLDRVTSEGRLVRNASGEYGLLDEAQSLMWPVTVGEAAIIQSRASTANHSSRLER